MSRLIFILCVAVCPKCGDSRNDTYRPCLGEFAWVEGTGVIFRAPSLQDHAVGVVWALTNRLVLRSRRSFNS